jgi:hypothetical protein
MTNVNCMLEVKVLGQRGKVCSIVIHVLAAAGLA